jgi:hypothetical protein
MAGIPADGAAGSVSESLSKLSCTLDPAEIKQKAGGGASCSFETGIERALFLLPLWEKVESTAQSSVADG